MPTQPNPRYHTLGRRIAALPTELVLQILDDLTLSRLLELAAITPALAPAIHAHARWGPFFTTVRPPQPEPSPYNYDSDPGDNRFLLKVKRERRAAKQAEWDKYNGYAPVSLLPEILEVHPVYLQIVRLAARKKPPHVLNEMLRLLDSGADSTTREPNKRTHWAVERFWGFSSLLVDELNVPNRGWGRPTPEDVAARERHARQVPIANARTAPRHGLIERVRDWLHSEMRFHLCQGYELYLPLLQRYTEYELPESLRDFGTPEAAELPAVFAALREAERKLNAEKAGQLLELAALIEAHPGWLLPLNRPHTPPFPPSAASEAHVARNYRRLAAQLLDDSRSLMLEQHAAADSVFGSDRHPLVPHDLLLQGLVSVLEKFPPGEPSAPWTPSQRTTLEFLTAHLPYVTPHSILPVRPPAPFDPHSNIYPPNPYLVPSPTPPIRTLSTPYSPLPPPTQTYHPSTPHFHPPTYKKPNLSPFRHSYGKNLHARPVRFNLQWYRSSTFRATTPQALRVYAPKGEDRWGEPGRLCGTVMPIEEDERRWLAGFLEICAAVKGMQGVVWGEGEGESVAAWWERTVEGGIRRGEGVEEGEDVWEDEEVVEKVEKLKVYVESD